MHTMVGVAFALLHVAIYQVLGFESGLAVWGLGIGIGHALFAGAVGMPMIGMIHPLIRSGQLLAPGFMVTNHPMGTGAGFFNGARRFRRRDWPDLRGDCLTSTPDRQDDPQRLIEGRPALLIKLFALRDN